MSYAQEIEQIEKDIRCPIHPRFMRTLTLAKKMQEELITLNKVEDANAALRGERDALLFLNKWIPCCERLPEEHGWYLVCFENSEYRAVDHWTGGGFSYPDMIAWMPLPEPYVP